MGPAHGTASFSSVSTAGCSVNCKFWESEFCHAQVVLLGYVVGQGQVAFVVAKVEAIHQYAVPKDKPDIMRFLGMAGYYHKFCQNFATIAAPLTELLQKKQKFM